MFVALMSALGHKQTFREYPLNVRFRGQSGSQQAKFLVGRVTFLKSILYPFFCFFGVGFSSLNSGFSSLFRPLNRIRPLCLYRRTVAVDHPSGAFEKKNRKVDKKPTTTPRKDIFNPF